MTWSRRKWGQYQLGNEGLADKKDGGRGEQIIGRRRKGAGRRINF